MTDATEPTDAERAALKGANTLVIPEIDTDGMASSMGDPGLVGMKVREMLGEAIAIRQRYHGEEDGDKASRDAQADIARLIERYAAEFRADNASYTQTLSLEAQAVWLRRHGYGTEDIDPADAVKALVADTIRRVIDATIAHENGGIDDAQVRFRVATATEDCISMLLGIENSADEEG